MIKIVSHLFRNPALSQSEFREYWETIHAPLIKSLLPGLVHYTASFPLQADGPKRPGGDIICDAIVELGFDDLATMGREMGSPLFNSPEREASSAHFMDIAKTLTLLVEEVSFPLAH